MTLLHSLKLALLLSVGFALALFSPEALPPPGRESPAQAPRRRPAASTMKTAPSATRMSSKPLRGIRTRFSRRAPGSTGRIPASPVTARARLTSTPAANPRRLSHSQPRVPGCTTASAWSATTPLTKSRATPAVPTPSRDSRAPTATASTPAPRLPGC